MTEMIDSYGGGSASGFDINIANKMLEDARQIVNFDKFSPSEDKHLIILGGQPAAGKSSIIEELKTQYNNNIVTLNGDEFKPLYPDYPQLAKDNPDQTSKMVQPYSNYVVDNLKQEALDRGLNTLIEGTMRTSTAPLETVEMFTNQGYTAEAFVISSNYFNSRIGIEQRYENEFAEKGYGRMVNVANHDEAYHNIPNTLQELVDSGKLTNITVATREAEILAETARGDDIVKAYTNHRDSLTPEIYLDVADRINEVNKMMEGRGASQSELDNLTNIKASLDNTFDKVFEQVRDAAQKLENIPAIEKEVREVKEIASTVLSFDANTSINEVLNSFEKYAPHLVEEIRNSNSIKYFDTDISLNHLDAKTVAEHISEKSNGKVGIEFEQQEKSKGYER